MRVLQVVHGFPPSGSGGTELYCESLARGLVEEGHDVSVFTREADASAAELRVRDEIRSGVCVRFVNNTFRHARSFEDTYDNPRVTSLFADLLREFRPDVAHVHHLTCLSTTILDALQEAGVPALLHLHDYWLLCHRGQLLDQALKRCDGPGQEGCARCTGAEGAAPELVYELSGIARRVRDALPAQLARSAQSAALAWASRRRNEAGARDRSLRRLRHMRERFDHVARALAPSRHARDRFVRAGFPGDRIVVSEYGVETASARTTDRGRGPLRAGFLGTLMASKAPHLLRDAIDLLPAGTVQATYFGAPAPYHGDALYADAIGDRLRHPAVTLHGPLRHADVPAALAALDVLVFPSIWEETSGIGAREALAAGIPVVASNIGGVPEFVRHDVNGLLFDPGDARDLARQLRRLVEDPTVLPRLRQGIDPLRSFDDDLKATIALYRTMATPVVAPVQPRRVAAVVLNYGTPADTANTVAWLLMADPPISHVVVVDNGDGRALQSALATSRAVQLVVTGANLGFAGGCNVGIRRALAAGADAVLLVNSDVVVPPDAVKTLAASLDAGAAIAGPVVRSRQRPATILSAGIHFDRRTGRMRNLKAVPAHPVALSAVSGCAMLIDRRVFDRLGLLPEPYFFGFEDIAFCQRARAAGLLVRLAPGASVYHEGSGTLGASPDRLYYGARNHLRLAAETPAASSLHAALRLGAICSYSTAHAVTTGGGSVVSRLFAVAHGTVDFFRGRDGPR